MKRLFGLFFLKIFGWKRAGEKPAIDKYVMLCVPHTSNWDFPLFLAAIWSFRESLNWLGKHTLFEGPLGWFYPLVGGVAVDRSAPGGLVAQITGQFATRDFLHVAIPPSGTRSFRDHWKSGFYRIALAADVPVVCAFLDFKTKTTGFGPTIYLTGDQKVDMDKIRAFYDGMQGKFVDKTSTVRLRSEDPDTEATGDATPAATVSEPEGR
ncbi:MAG: 1-acyl-sn-glycerol-3-phosphate acyltransferase [Bradymonadia bacterium]|jgi:1-acyl-sn-glycerol-3-phosphate acyltransferase